MASIVLLQDVLAVGSGSLVGFSLGLIGGGGSILAVPLLLYIVGIGDPHTAIGTSALAVGATAMTNLLPHARAGHVRWRSATIFAATGIGGALVGSSMGKAVEGQRLLALFAGLMIVVALLMQRERRTLAVQPISRAARCGRLAAAGFGAGGLSGFFGIGGGFLIVPGLILAGGVPIIEAIGSSLVSVSAFGFTTAASYAASGLIDWRIAATYLLGGAVGGWVGARLATRLAKERKMLNRIFGAVLVAVAIYMLYRSAAAWA
ncbi:MAG TPA: sulfite exporter TauE/SafE family protein [Alphaproteobacteria bacterium]|nr:sulfite exporter TauE/SafE family protein [Alphaproteobacteria bacterium]